MLPEVIQTERLLLRPFSFKDVNDVLTYATDPEWARYLPVPQPYTQLDAEKFIASRLLDLTDHLFWAIEYASSVIGGINIRFFFNNRVGEIGYSVARWLWGKGLTTEAARAVINAAFSSIEGLNRIRAMADERNIGSLRVMAKLGMLHEGVLRQNRYTKEEFVNEVYCGILRSEWEALKDK